ncbi:MAG: hypothetical protein SGILL_005401, partial [Bacillariaceae sp.]
LLKHQEHRLDFFLQKNLLYLARHLQTPSNGGGGNTPIQLHAFPFTNQDFYKVQSEGSRTSREEKCLADPRMKSVQQVADIISALVLPSYDQVKKVMCSGCEGTSARTKDRTVLIVTSFLARPLAFLLARLHPDVKVYILNLQPICPNGIFPNYRVSTQNFVDAIMKHEDDTERDESLIETYWKLEHALEAVFLADRMKELCQQHQTKGCSSSGYYSWEELQQILLGHNDRFIQVNAYSNHLVPSLENESTPRVHEVGPLADAYIPPGSPPRALVNFLQRYSGERRPICVGFGSMVFPNPQIVLQALQKIDQPAVLVGSSLRVENIPDGALKQFVSSYVYFTSNVPYPWLLPHCRMTICHGGAGVVHACLRAGIPCVVAPVMGDQHAWGSLLEAKGLGLLIRKQRMLDLTEKDIIVAVESILSAMNGIVKTNSKTDSLLEHCHRLRESIREDPQTGSEKLVIDLLGGVVD